MDIGLVLLIVFVVFACFGAYQKSLRKKELRLIAEQQAQCFREGIHSATMGLDTPVADLRSMAVADLGYWSDVKDDDERRVVMTHFARIMNLPEDAVDEALSRWR